MSHITRVQLRVRDLDALKEAAEARGLVFARGVKKHKSYGGSYGTCEHVLRLKDAQAGDYEIGVVKAYDGSEGYDLAFDQWGQGRMLAAVDGPAMNGLRREYAAAVAVKRAKQKLAVKGFSVKRENLGSRIRLRLVRR